MHTQEKETKGKRKEEEEKYYKTAHMYVLCKKSLLKYHFSLIYKEIQHNI
jgi:hypothetical protein